MSVRKLRSQAAEHDSGLVVRSAGRETIQLVDGDRTLDLDVERGVGATLFYIPAEPIWSDGTTIGPERTEELCTILSEVMRFWGGSAEFRYAGQSPPV